MNRNRWVAVVAVAAMLVLAGCGGDAGPGTGTGTAAQTETATPTSTPAPSVETVAYPDGMAASGFENATVFLQNHRNAMTSGPSYAVRMDVTAGRETQTLRSSTDPDSERIRSQTERNDAVDYEIYYGEDTQYVRQVNDGSSTYGTTNATFRSAAEGLNGGQFITTVVLLNLEVSDVTVEDDQTIITYDIQGPRSESEGIAEADGTVQMNTDGQLVSFEYDLVSTEGREVSVTWERIDVGSATVEQPDWLEQAES
jgi:hypothetical protein